MTLFEYRMQALNGLWKARKTAQVIMEDVLAERLKKSMKDSVPTTEIGTSKSSDISRANVASDLTLLLLFPLIESQTRADPSLKSTIIQLLSKFFENSTPMSVHGPKEQLDKIESLLINWITEDQCEEAAYGLVALACARNSVETLIRTTKVLLSTQLNLDANVMLDKVLKMDYEDQNPKTLDVHYHMCGFHYSAR